MWTSELSSLVGNWPAAAVLDSAQAAVAHTGLSGARVWRVSSATGPLCLRRWPAPSLTREQLQWMHAMLRRAYENGCQIVPVPLATRGGDSTLCHGGHFWELTPWMPGAPVSAGADRRCEKHLIAALEALAEFHVAVNSTDSQPSTGTAGASAALRRRAEAIEQMQDDEMSQLKMSIRADTWPAAAELARRIVSQGDVGRNVARATLESWRETRLPLQACIRDVHREHMLFTGRRVTGLIDFGAMQVDSRAGDIARLLGSWAGDDPGRWQVGIDAYTTVAPLSAAERRAIRIFDTSAIVLSAINWVRWIFAEQRDFGQPTAVLDRMTTLAQRLENLVRNGPLSV